ncbi:hypothetical protein DFH06DRAFT_1319928 [Mycena polygramma]|nr:hypothetical protein DFH06DRAFT_1319920 [Mycena polygramma]KAJ7672503.1 hypothetical protein DFH06DRAFT_1363483 [Mycena polygramma]KAJ7672507.1 hypothetical protein DFH06DRAFT_1319928 [Mycena polygramma]
MSASGLTAAASELSAQCAGTPQFSHVALVLSYNNPRASATQHAQHPPTFFSPPSSSPDHPRHPGAGAGGYFCSRLASQSSTALPHHEVGLTFRRSTTSSAVPGRLGANFPRHVLNINHHQRRPTSVKQVSIAMFKVRQVLTITPCIFSDFLAFNRADCASKNQMGFHETIKPNPYLRGIGFVSVQGKLGLYSLGLDSVRPIFKGLDSSLAYLIAAIHKPTKSSMLDSNAAASVDQQGCMAIHKTHSRRPTLALDAEIIVKLRAQLSSSWLETSKLSSKCPTMASFFDVCVPKVRTSIYIKVVLLGVIIQVNLDCALGVFAASG